MSRDGASCFPIRVRGYGTHEQQGEINHRQYQWLFYAREHGRIARREYAQLNDTSERTTARDLADLATRGLLEATDGRGWRTAYHLPMKET